MGVAEKREKDLLQQKVKDQEDRIRTLSDSLSKSEMNASELGQAEQSKGGAKASSGGVRFCSCPIGYATKGSRISYHEIAGGARSGTGAGTRIKSSSAGYHEAASC